MTAQVSSAPAATPRSLGGGEVPHTPITTLHMASSRMRNKKLSYKQKSTYTIAIVCHHPVEKNGIYIVWLAFLGLIPMMR